MVPAPSHRVSRVPWYSGYCCRSLHSAYGAITLYGRPSQGSSAMPTAGFSAARTPPCTHGGLGSSHSARRYSGNRCFFLFLRLLRCFSSPGIPPWGYVFTPWYIRYALCGFPHSDTCGSLCICHSPQLFAAYHVFHRLSVPRHPPCALLCLAIACCLTPSVAYAAFFVAYWLLMSFLAQACRPCLAFISWYSVFKVRLCGLRRDGLKWTRTTDLTLIRRAL